MRTLTTGELAEQAGVNVQTVRYYERRGLLPEPPRTPSGYREYGPGDLRRLRFIRRAKSLGFRLSEIETLLNLRVEENRSCDAVQDRAAEALARIDEQVEQLHQIRRALSSLVDACRKQEPTGDCPILETLENRR